MSDRESMDVDILIVGGGPAGLAASIQLMRSIEMHNQAISEGTQSGNVIEEPMIVLIEKAATVGSHGISGGIMVPTVLEELFPDRKSWKFDTQVDVTQDKMKYFSKGSSFGIPHPPGHTNKGNLIISLNQMTTWLAEEAESLGVNIFPGFGGVEILYDDAGAVSGVRTGDKGLDKDGNPKANYEAGIDLKAKVTLFSEGVRGTLTKQLVKEKNLDHDRMPMIYSTGVKELWELPEGRTSPGTVVHTMGWPLKKDEFGGGFIYHLNDNRVSLGFITALDYRDPYTDPHANLQRYKTHPDVKKLLTGGKLISYGAKAIPEGGWDCLPKLYGPGFLIAGDSAGFLNLPQLKGIHLAMKSGMLAAETCLEALVAQDYSEEKLSSYFEKIESSFLGKELKQTRSFRQHFDGNFFLGLVGAGIDLATKGKVNILSHRLESDDKTLKPSKEYHGSDVPEPMTFDGVLTFDKLSDVYHSGTQHEEDQCAHLKVADTDLCVTRCQEEYGNPCVKFCPAAVYEIENNDSGNAALKLNFSNCVHCKTCDIKDPYENITWTLPEGGGGPSYKGL